LELDKGGVEYGRLDMNFLKMYDSLVNWSGTLVVLLMLLPLILYFLLKFILNILPFFKKEKTILPKKENENFGNFFERQFEGVVNGTVENLSVNHDDSKENNVKRFLDSEICAFYNNDEHRGTLINCHKGDGISWLSEKFLGISNAILKKYDYNIEIITIVKDKSESPFPVISTLIGGERKLLKLATEKEFIKNTSFSFISKMIALGAIANFIVILEKMNINISGFLLQMIIFGVVIIAFIYTFIDESRKKRKEFLNELEKFDENDNKEKDKKYQLLKNEVVKKLDNLFNKIIIIDDITSIDEFSQDVIFETCKRNKKCKIFWIIFNSSWSREIISKNSKIFTELILKKLNQNEKKEILKKIGLSEKNVSLNTIKEICIGQIDEETRQTLKNELFDLKNKDLELFNFLYLLSLNDFPRGSEYKIKTLIKKISPRQQERERDMCIKKIFESVPNENRLDDYFKDDRIKKYYNRDKEKISIDSSLSCLIEDEPDLFGRSKYRYGQGYWALLWYYASYKNDPKVHFVQKICHHLQKSENDIEEIEVRTCLLNAQLFTIEKNLSYLQKNAVQQMLTQYFKLNTQNIKDIQKDRVIKLILDAFLNFDCFSGNKSRLEDLECEELYEFLETKETNLVCSLLQNKNYSFISDYIIPFLLDQYWEIIFFHWIFYKSDSQYNLTEDISFELTELKKYFENYFDNEKKEYSILYLFNHTLYIWIDYIRLLKNDWSINDEPVMTEQIIQRIELFSFIYNKASANISKNEIYQWAIIQESICLIVSVTLLLLKKQNIKEKQKLLKVLQIFKNIFNEVELDTENYDKSIDDIMRFLLLHSLMWKNCGFSVRYTMLSIIRIQMFLFLNDKEKYTNEIIEKAKLISQVTEKKVDDKKRLNVLLNFSLYLLNSDLIKNKYDSSFLFQQALEFTDKDKISNIQFEYLYFCIQKCWYHDGEKLKEILKCLIKCSDQYDQYFDNILKKICEDPDSYLKICNCLNAFDYSELSLRIDKTKYTLVTFFDKILELSKLKEDVNIENAECIWRNYKFQLLSDQEKQAEKQNFEEFWEKRKSNIIFGWALEKLFELDENNVQEKTMCDTYNFLISNESKILHYSFNLIIACHFCNKKKNKETLDKEYETILDLIKKYEQDWEKRYGHIYTSSIFLYKKLFEHTKKYGYYEKYKGYELLETQRKIKHFEVTDSGYFDFFYNLYYIFRYDWSVESIDEDISPTERQLLDSGNQKGFLDSIDYRNIYAIRNDKISERYIELYSLRNIEFVKQKDMFNICNELAKNSINALIQLIVQMPENRKYYERLQILYDELKKPASYDDEI